MFRCGEKRESKMGELRSRKMKITWCELRRAEMMREVEGWSELRRV